MSKAEDSKKHRRTEGRAYARADGNMKGEGDHESAKRFNDAETSFVKSGRAQKAAGRAAPESPRVARELAEAEAAGLSRSKAEDPAVSRTAEIEPRMPGTKTVTAPEPAGNGTGITASQFAGNDPDNHDVISSERSDKGPMEGNASTAHATEAAHEFAQSEKARHAGHLRAKTSPTVSGGTGRPKTK